MGHSIGKRQDHVLDTTFHLKFVERLYDGSPRWWSNEWEKHAYPSGHDDPLDREAGVKALIVNAAEGSFYIGTDRMITCVNPDCPVRSWRLYSRHGLLTEILNENAIRADFWDSHEAIALAAGINDGLEKMSNGQFDKLPETCPNCSKKQAVFSLSDIKGKWVYVLKGTSSPKPFLEIFIKDPNNGSIHPQFQNGRFTDETRAFDGKLVLEKIKDFTWHFFLSPVRLGPCALSELSSSPTNLVNIGRCLGRDPGKWKVGFMTTLQPWATTVCRKFQSRQLQTHYEFIPLVDPFSWVAQISECDFLPMLAARQRLIQDSDENAKAFIASTLAKEIGREKVSDGPPPVYSKAKEDPWNVKDDTAPPPHEFKSSGNIAQAWVDRYKAALLYLTNETNFACSRVSFTVRFSLAHRIVEIACQEDPRSLSFGLIHWTHILQPMLACGQVGQSFTVWAARYPDARERIPQKSVLRGDGVGPGSRVNPSLPLNVFMYLTPAIVNGSHNPASDLTQHLAKFDIDAALSPSLENFLTLQGKTLEVASSYVDDYVDSLPDVIDSTKLKTASIATSLKERLTFFSKVQQVEDFLNLYTVFTGWSEKEKNYTTGWDELSESKEKIEKPVKVAEFICGATERLVKSGMSGDILEIAETLEKRGIATLGAEELKNLKASKVLRAFKWAGVGEKLLSGPIGLVTGGLTLVIELGKVKESYESGDPGAAVAHGVLAAAADLVVCVAYAECASLFAGAAEVAWIGPVGLIAAAVMLIGAIILYFCAKNDLQMYAQHCFLGKSYGEGGFGKTGKRWMTASTGTVMGWAGLRYYQGTAAEHADRWKRQRMALLRMLTGFSTWMGMTGADFKPLTWYILPSYVPTGAYFDVEMDFAPEDGGEMETCSVRVLPLAANGNGEWVWTGSKPGIKSAPRGFEAEIYTERKSDGQISIRVRIAPTYSTPKYRAAESRVRLVYDASGHVTLPATGWVKNKFDYPSYSNTVASGDFEGQEEEEKDEEKEVDEDKKGHK